MLCSFGMFPVCDQTSTHQSVPILHSLTFFQMNNITQHKSHYLTSTFVFKTAFKLEYLNHKVFSMALWETYYLRHLTGQTDKLQL